MGRTVEEAGYHKSIYNIMAKVPNERKYVIANLLKGTAAAYSVFEMLLLKDLMKMDEEHPFAKRMKELGFIANYDEREALKSLARINCSGVGSVFLTICPTMGCNFDCPYCFEDHKPGVMSESVQDDIIALAGRMVDTFKATSLSVTWYGGEPLLAPQVIENLTKRFKELCPEYAASIITNGYLLTQPIVDMLERCDVKKAQITLDGVGPVHDMTRHLAGGGPTFDRIVENLRTLKIPFEVSIRHNVHKDNKDQIEPLKSLVESIAKESGNNLQYYNFPVSDSRTMERRGAEVDMLDSDERSEVTLIEFAKRFKKGRGIYCGASAMDSVVINEKGELLRCWEDVDKGDELSFGNAKTWNPADPISTADRPDIMIKYINASLPIDDKECMDCLWLPACSGGCPNRRLFYGKECFKFKDDPEAYALMLYRRIEEQKAEKKKSKE